MAPGRLGSDPAIGASTGGVGIDNGFFVVGAEIYGPPGSFKGPITGRARIGITPRGGGGASGAGGARGGTIPATEDFEDPLPREGS